MHTLLRNLLTAVLAFAALLPAASQNETNEQMGGVYYAYHYEPGFDTTPPPAGFRPFYISHYGRHGSRWLPSDERYERVLEQFADTSRLTPLGRDVRRRLLLVWSDAQGRGGDLTALGARQQQEIASRMRARWPEVFQADSVCIEARSSVVGRCAASMTAFLLRLQQLSPQLHISAACHHRFMPWIAYASPEQQALEARVERTIHVSPQRLMASLFVEPDSVERPMDLLSELHCIASDMQDVEIGVSLFNIFTPEEIRAVYEANNEHMWLCNSTNSVSCGIPERSAVSLWQNFEEEADSAIKLKTPAATLRFGHDTSLYRLLSLLGLYTDEHRMDRLVPMAANLFLAFYADKEGHVLVKMLHNEHEVQLPIATSTPPYYDWQKVKDYARERIARL